MECFWAWYAYFYLSRSKRRYIWETTYRDAGKKYFRKQDGAASEYYQPTQYPSQPGSFCQYHSQPYHTQMDSMFTYYVHYYHIVISSVISMDEWEAEPRARQLWSHKLLTSCLDSAIIPISFDNCRIPGSQSKHKHLALRFGFGCSLKHFSFATEIFEQEVWVNRPQPSHLSIYNVPH